MRKTKPTVTCVGPLALLPNETGLPVNVHVRTYAEECGPALVNRAEYIVTDPATGDAMCIGTIHPQISLATEGHYSAHGPDGKPYSDERTLAQAIGVLFAAYIGGEFNNSL